MSHKPNARVNVLESDLYPVVEKYFTAAGFAVKGEVCGCELVARGRL
jgi:hypothetical protein